jgi:hypothetical protein
MPRKSRICENSCIVGVPFQLTCFTFSYYHWPVDPFNFSTPMWRKIKREYINTYCTQFTSGPGEGSGVNVDKDKGNKKKTL